MSLYNNLEERITISSDDAISKLSNGEKLNNYNIVGEINFEGYDTFNIFLVMENCTIENFSLSCSNVVKHVNFIGCEFLNCKFIFTYFTGGLTIINCKFKSYLDFQAGGHNKQPIRIEKNIFHGFVNFFDCIYENTVTIIDNEFKHGSNLLGSPYNISVTFAIEPEILNNEGELNLGHEGT
jgi:hypothetical protein